MRIAYMCTADVETDIMDKLGVTMSQISFMRNSADATLFRPPPAAPVESAGKAAVNADALAAAAQPSAADSALGDMNREVEEAISEEMDDLLKE